MSTYLQIYPVTLPAGQDFAKLDITADSLAVFETNAPFILTDESGSTFELDRACRLNVKTPGYVFRKLKIVRPSGVTGDISVKFSVGNGVEFIDGRLQYTSTTKVDAEFAVTALPPQTRARFMPRFVATVNLLGTAQYKADSTQTPTVIAGTAAALNLLAPRSIDAAKRIVRLTSGASAKIGFGGGVSGPDTPGNFLELTTAEPEREIPGGESLYGVAAADAELTVLEVGQSPAGALVAIPATQPAALTPAELAGITPTLSGGFSASYEFGTALLGIRTGNPNWDSWGLMKATGWNAQSTFTEGAVNTATTLVFSGITSAQAAQAVQTGEGESATASYFYMSIRATAATAGKKILFSGQSFVLPWSSAFVGTTVYMPGENDSSYVSKLGMLRIVFPWDGSTPYAEQYRQGAWRNY